MLRAFLIVAVTSIALGEEPVPPAPAESPAAIDRGNSVSTIADMDFAVEVRLVTTTERLIDLLPDRQPIELTSKPTVDPFEDWKPLGPGETSIVRAVESHRECVNQSHTIELTDKDMSFFVEAVSGDRWSNFVFCPKIVVADRQLGTVSDVTEIAYRRDAAASFESVVEHAAEGLTINVRAFELNDGRCQTDTKITLESLTGKDAIPKDRNGVLMKPPEIQRQTVAVSVSSEHSPSHFAIVPGWPQPRDAGKSREISLASRIIGRDKPETPPTFLVCLISTYRLNSNEAQNQPQAGPASAAKIQKSR